MLTILEQQNKHFLVFLGVILVTAIGLVDSVTGRDFGLSIFYVLPILLVSWYTNQGFGLAISVFSSLVGLFADVAASHPHVFSVETLWNAFIRLAFFVLIALLTTSLKKSLKLARTDYLTSAVNSRCFYELVQMEMDRLQRYKRPFTIAYIDLDNFKKINDQFGHNTGDEVLIALTTSIAKVVRKSDTVARLGGDEFAVLFPETNQEVAPILLAKIQDSFLNAPRTKDWSITFSGGVLTCLAAPNSIHDLIEIVDNLMYSAKAEGRNTVKYSSYAG